MSKKKIISIIGVIVLVLGALWFISQGKATTPLLEEENQVAPGVQAPLDENTAVQNEQEKAPVDVEKKFNESMVKARKAFGASDYSSAIRYYNEALSYKKDDTAYVGLYTVYLTQKNWAKALESINKAIAVSALYGDYWKWKLLVMNEGMNASFADLEKVYTEGLPKVKTEEKINLVTYFADMSARKGEKSYAINLWQKAIEMNPQSKAIYQKEIDALK
jgi:tetratricopeptide (TPR) repeat protein